MHEVPAASGVAGCAGMGKDGRCAGTGEIEANSRGAYTVGSAPAVCCMGGTQRCAG